MDDVKSFDSVKDQIKPFDLLLFRGTDYISKIIRVCEYEMDGTGQFSHAGLVITSDVLPFLSELAPDTLYVWESTMSISIDGRVDGGNIPNIETHKGKFGVQIRKLEDVLESYTKTEGSRVAWCQLIHNPWYNVFEREHIIDNLKDFHNTYGFRLYELNPLVLLSAVFPCCRRLRDCYDYIVLDGHKILVNLKLSSGKETKDQVEEQTLFCSQFVTMVYKHIGLVPNNIDPSNVSPVSFIIGKDIPKLVRDPIYIIPNKKNNI